MIKHVKNVRFAIAKLAFWHEALLCGIGHQNGWKQISSVLSAYKVVIFSGGYSCKSPYKCSTDTLRWYATYVETSHFTLCFHKQNKGSLILHGICTIFECCLEVRNPDSQHVFCSPPARWGLLDFIRAHARLLPRLLLRLLLLLDYLSSSPSSSPPPLPPPLPPCSTSTSALPTLPTRRQALRQLPSSVCTAGCLNGQIECQKICQIKCHEICQIECQKICQIECQKICQKLCQIECQIACQKICQIECQKICQ